EAGIGLLHEFTEARPFLAELRRVLRSLEFVGIRPLHVIDDLLRCRLTETKPGWVAIKRARSIISLRTSSWLSAGSLTTLICVQMPSVRRISDMANLLADLPRGYADNAQHGRAFCLASRHTRAPATR